MRLVGEFTEEKLALRFSHFLTHEGITNELESLSPETEPRNAPFKVWVQKEEDLSLAVQWFADFNEDPEEERFRTGARQGALRKPPPKERVTHTIRPQPSPHRLTIFIIMICVSLFLFMEASTFLPGSDPLAYPDSMQGQIQRALFFDYSYKTERAIRIFRQYGMDVINNPEALPPEAIEQLNALERVQSWNGFYHLFFNNQSVTHPWWYYDGPIFEMIQRGEVWRLVTPILMHGDLFHLLFNMLWVWTLGTQLERKLGIGRYLFFILITAALSNTAQYLMGGPGFLGISGVITAMAGFIWARQQKAPWEGYLLHRSTITFLGIYILAMAAIGLLIFIATWLKVSTFSIHIANTAHLSGALAGYAIGRTELLSVK